MTQIDLRIDLPHASLLVRVPNTVSVIIRSKTLKTGSVENVRGSLALSQMRSGSTEAACCVDPWGYLTTLSRVTPRAHLSTLRHFDIKPRHKVKTGPLIPCERRLRQMEISENQEPTFGTRFGNRDYGRPYTHFSVTLGCFD